MVKFDIPKGDIFDYDELKSSKDLMTRERLVYVWKKEGRGGKPVELNLANGAKFSLRVGRIDNVSGRQEVLLKKLDTSPYLNLFDDLSMHVLVGQNGSGKTSTLEAIAETVTQPNKDSLHIYQRGDGGYYGYLVGKYDLISNIEGFEQKRVGGLERMNGRHPKVFYLSNIFDGEIHSTIHSLNNISFEDLSTNSFINNKGLDRYKDDEIQFGLNLLSLKGNESLGTPPFKIPGQLMLNLKFYNVNLSREEGGVLDDVFHRSLASHVTSNESLTYCLAHWWAFSYLLKIESDLILKSEIWREINTLPSYYDYFKQKSNKDYSELDAFLEKIIQNVGLINLTMVKAMSGLNDLKEFSFSVILDDGRVDEKVQFVNSVIKDVRYLQTTLFDGIKQKVLWMKWSGLSTGEIALFNLFSRFIEYQGNHSLNNIILVDEPDCMLHPEWQREFISHFVKAMNWFFIGNGQWCQVIFATHSPIMLSDMPRSNVIYLGDIEKSTNTFGANIHSLYKDSFFLQGGVIGVFAKEKIERLIQYLLPVDKRRKDIEGDVDNDFTKESAQSLIEMIGEPFIQSKVQDLFNSRYGADDEIGELEKRLAYLKSKKKGVKE